MGNMTYMPNWKRREKELVRGEDKAGWEVEKGRTHLKDLEIEPAHVELI